MSARDVLGVAFLDVWRLPLADRPDAILSALAAAGYAVVPVEPTREMLGAMWHGYQQGTQTIRMRDVYDAMLAAAAQEPEA